MPGPYATDYTTLLTGSYWSGAEVTNKPVFITYSFDAVAPASDAANLAPSAYATFKPFTAAQQTQAIQALTAWSSASTVAGGGSGITFLKVAPGKGDINFASYDFSTDDNAKGSGGEGFYPWGNWNYSTFGTNTGHFGADLQGPGNILMNTAFTSGGLFSDATLLHEVGHALGLKHPTEAWTDAVNGWIDVPHNQWDPSVAYDPNFSIMSAGGDGTSTLTGLTAADYAAIQSIYGTRDMAANEDTSWSWNSATMTLTQTLKDDGETVRGVSTSNVINGGLGSDAIYAIGSGGNTVFGGGGDDSLVGGSGVSYLDGGAGADTINGWFGASTASYADAAAGVTANLRNASLNTGDAAGDSYLHISRVQGSTYNDTIVAEDSGDVLHGMAGNDSLVGGAGADTLYGEAGNDTMAGGAGTNYLDGGAGADSMTGSGGTTYAIYWDATAGVTVNLLNTAANTGDAAGDSYVALHNIPGLGLRRHDHRRQCRGPAVRVRRERQRRRRVRGGFAVRRRWQRHLGRRSRDELPRRGRRRRQHDRRRRHQLRRLRRRHGGRERQPPEPGCQPPATRRATASPVSTACRAPPSPTRSRAIPRGTGSTAWPATTASSVAAAATRSTAARAAIRWRAAAAATTSTAGPAPTVWRVPAAPATRSIGTPRRASPSIC